MPLLLPTTAAEKTIINACKPMFYIHNQLITHTTTSACCLAMFLLTANALLRLDLNS